MKTFQTEVQIGALPSRVWQVLTDFARWGEWNQVLHARGEARLGGKLDRDLPDLYRTFNLALKARVES